MSPPSTAQPGTYEKPLNQTEPIYETIDHKPPKGKTLDRKGVSFDNGEEFEILLEGMHISKFFADHPPGWQLNHFFLS